MALTVATNNGSLTAQAAASSVNREMSIAMERLSTGKRINAASDDAAGVAIASRLSAEITGTNMAIRNAMDGQAMIDTAEGAHIEVTNILQRMRELAVQSANDTNSAVDRSNLQTEISQLSTELDRIAQVTSWAGKALLNGTTTGSAAPSNATDVTFTFHVGANSGSENQVTATIQAVSAAKLGLDSNQVADISTTLAYSGSTDSVAANWAGTVTVGTAGSGTTADTEAKLTFADHTTGPTTAGDSLLITLEGQTVTVDISADDLLNYNLLKKEGKAQLTVDHINAAGISGITASRSGGVVTITKANLDITTQATATSSITKIDAALATINTQRATMGALSNRLESTISNLTSISNNLMSGKGRIEDADFAQETSTLAKTQILQQASTAMLAQANAMKQNVLSLLQG